MGIDLTRMMRAMREIIGEEWQLGCEITGLLDALESETTLPHAKEAAADRLNALAEGVLHIHCMSSAPWSFGSLISGLGDAIELPNISPEKRNEYARTILNLFDKWDPLPFVLLQTLEVGRNFAISLGMMFEVKDVSSELKENAANALIHLSQKASLVNHKDISHPLARSLGLVIQDASTTALQKQEAGSVLLVQARRMPIPARMMDTIIQGMENIIGARDTMPVQKLEAANILINMLIRGNREVEFSHRDLVDLFGGLATTLEMGGLSVEKEKNVVSFLKVQSRVEGLLDDAVFNLAKGYHAILSKTHISVECRQEVASALITLSSRNNLSDDTVFMIASGLGKILEIEGCALVQKGSAASKLIVLSRQEELSHNSIHEIIKGFSFIFTKILEFPLPVKAIVWDRISYLTQNALRENNDALLRRIIPSLIAISEVPIPQEAELQEPSFFISASIASARSLVEEIYNQRPALRPAVVTTTTTSTNSEQ